MSRWPHTTLSAIVLVVAALLPVVATAMPVADVLQFHMDEPLWDGTPGEVTDSSGMDHHGTAAGDATTTLGGYASRCGTFDGVGDLVNCGTASTLVPINQITMEAWIKPDPVGAWGADRIILARNNSYYFEIAADKRIRSLLYFPSSTPHTGWLYGPDLSTYGDEWLHVVTTFDGTTATDNHAIWINGQQVAIQSTGIHNIKDIANPLYIGSVDGGRFFKGKLDEVGIYSRVLTPNEIWAHAHAEPQPDILDLQMEEPAWTGAPDEVIDSSGAGHHGTIIVNPSVVSTGLSHIGQAASIPPNGSRVNCGTDSSLVPPGAGLTIDAWIKPDWDTWSQDGTIVTREHSYYLQVNANGTLAAYLYPLSGGNVWLLGPDLKAYGDDWLHVALTWDGAVETLYVNGMTEPGWSQPFVTTGIRDLLDPTEVGSMKGGRRFSGLIDQVGIFSWALSPDEVARRAYVPEPATLTLLGLGLIALRRRRRQ